MARIAPSIALYSFGTVKLSSVMGIKSLVRTWPLFRKGLRSMSAPAVRYLEDMSERCQTWEGLLPRPRLAASFGQQMS